MVLLDVGGGSWHGGWSVGTSALGTTGSTRLDGICGDIATSTSEVPPAGSVCWNDQIGWVPFGAASVTRIREPSR